MTCCHRCGADTDDGAVLAVTVNDIRQLARDWLCGDCRTRVAAALQQALRPVGHAAAW